MSHYPRNRGLHEPVGDSWPLRRRLVRRCYDGHMETSEPASPGKKPAGCGSIVLGLLLIAVGIPMLVLPGPGIAAVLGGLALVWRGVKGVAHARKA